MSIDSDQTKSNLISLGQGHILEYINSNNPEDNSILKKHRPEDGELHPILHQVKSLNIASAIQHLKEAQQQSKDPIVYDLIRPVSVITFNDNNVTSNSNNNNSSSSTSQASINSSSTNNNNFHQHQKHSYIQTGEQAINQGQIAAVILSGGQGTRLGHNGPKGMFCLPPPLSISQKSIFQIHMERLLKLSQLVAASCSNRDKDNNKTGSYIKNGSVESPHTATVAFIPVYIMTSDLNDSVIRQYFIFMNYFNYPVENIYFFQQALMPCFDLQGKIIVESLSSLSLAPDGNGGIYEALRSTGALHDMNQRRIKYLHVYGIDNILTKSLDPLFMGLCVQNKIQCGNKVVGRSNKQEKVGLTVSINNRMHILEYSEMPVTIAESEDAETGALKYSAANICNHFLSLSFIQDVVLPKLSSFYHIAMKKIPYYDLILQKTVTPNIVNGMKLEMFIFDVFPLAGSSHSSDNNNSETFTDDSNAAVNNSIIDHNSKKTANDIINNNNNGWIVMQVNRDDEFAPIKNANTTVTTNSDSSGSIISIFDIDAIVDTPDSPNVAIKLMSNQAKKWLLQYHVTFVYPVTAVTPQQRECVICEISPLLSYSGEGLERYAYSSITLPCYLHE